MAELRSIGNSGGVKSAWAPLTNLPLAAEALDRAIHAGRGMHKVVAFYGPTGVGKTQAALYCQNQHNAFYVQCERLWSKKATLAGLAQAMGIHPGRTATDIFDQVAEQLRLSQRPLILDEVDYIVGKEMLDVLRDLYERSRCTLMIIGEELLPRTLKAASPRFHNRIVKWQPASFATLGDARKLADYYIPGLQISDDMLAHLLESSGKVAMTLRNLLEEVSTVAESDGIKRLDRAAWGKRQLSASDGPVRSFR